MEGKNKSEDVPPSRWGTQQKIFGPSQQAKDCRGAEVKSGQNPTYKVLTSRHQRIPAHGTMLPLLRPDLGQAVKACMRVSPFKLLLLLFWFCNAVIQPRAVSTSGKNSSTEMPASPICKCLHKGI